MEEEAYLDKGKSLEAKERGNDHFKQNNYAEAIKEYNDSIRRDPTNASTYSNRATCYAKLAEWQRCLDDCETALKLDPKFVRVYIRKAKTQHVLKQFHKALDTYNKGLELDPTNSELLENKQLTMEAIYAQNPSGQADPERLKEAMKDPEIREILRDPIMNKVLSDLKDDPRASRTALADKDIRAKFEKLIAAGIVSLA